MNKLYKLKKELRECGFYRNLLHGGFMRTLLILLISILFTQAALSEESPKQCIKVYHEDADFIDTALKANLTDVGTILNIEWRRLSRIKARIIFSFPDRNTRAVEIMQNCETGELETSWEWLDCSNEADALREQRLCFN